jgi:hypothetical protein
MAAEYTEAALQRTFDHLLVDEQRITALREALVAGVLQETVEPTGIRPYQLLQWTAMHQLNAAALATEGPTIQDTWARIAIRDNAPTGIWRTMEMLQVVEQIYAQHATVPQQAATVERSLDGTTRHITGFARLGGRTIGNSYPSNSR